MNCCDYDCHQGRDCPARKTPTTATERAAQFQADTDRLEATGHADNTNEFSGDLDEIIIDGIAVALIVWLVAFVFAPALAVYLSHMRG